MSFPEHAIVRNAKKARERRLVAFAERLSASRAESPTAQLTRTPSNPKPAAEADLYLWAATVPQTLH